MKLLKERERQLKTTILLMVVLYCFKIDNEVFCQNDSPIKDGYSFGFFSFLTVKEEFKPNYSNRKDARVSSAPRISYIGKFELNKTYWEKIEGSFGVLAGTYPVDFVFAFDSVFSAYGVGYEDYSISRYVGVHLGINGGVEYRLQLAKRHFIAPRFGLNLILFIPSFYGNSHSSIRNTGVYKIFEADANFNPKGKVFLAPEFSIRYYYAIFKKYVPYMALNGVYSNSYPLVGSKYSLYGKNETLTGTFRRRYMHAGIEVGVRVHWR